MRRELKSLDKVFCILQLFSGKSEVGGGVYVLISVMFWEDNFDFSVGNIQYFQPARVTVLIGIFIDFEPIRNSLVTF